MKLQKKIEFEFTTIRRQYPKIKSIAERTKARHLWQQEAAVRERIKSLRKMRAHAPKGFDAVYADYVALLESLSHRILDAYNEQRGTTFRFEAVVKGRFNAYLRTGILSVLMTSHIPALLTDSFNRHLPANPKDEYPAARAMRRHFVLHLGATNTGKTYHAIQRLMKSERGAYLAPLRVLALENFERMNAEGVPCNLLTGEEEIRVPGARITSCTVEKLALDAQYDVAVVDEVQLMADSQRGAAWVRAILALNCPEIHLCGALNAKEQLIRMIEDCGDDYEFRPYFRAVPLRVQARPVELSGVRRGDALIAFSKKRVSALAAHLEERGIPAAVIYGDLPPEVRRMQYNAFLSGEKQVLVSTDAIGMGVNLPIRRIVFTELLKYDGEEVRELTSQEVKQIAGRAGRLGIYDVGYVAATSRAHTFLEHRLEAEDTPIEQAVVGPSEALIDIGILPLREKLALWSAREEALPHYRKMDVRDQLLVLDRIAAYRLPERVQWQLIMLPFDVHSEERMDQFLDYVEARFVRRANALQKPAMERQDLNYLEGYYQGINLYYAFSRAFSMPLDEAWVYETRRTVSERINRQLSKKKRPQERLVLARR
ncbi:MAG: helicase-related protein [Christensenellales bacterium]|jgi:ATP-dependent RNA helicase SUPV3L1/SUV3